MSESSFLNTRVLLNCLDTLLRLNFLRFRASCCDGGEEPGVYDSIMSSEVSKPAVDSDDVDA